jgi:hypothetical protein
MQDAPTVTDRINRFYDILFSVEEAADDRTFYYPAKALSWAQQHGEKALEAVATAETGYMIYSRGNSTKGVDMVLKALQLAEKTGNQQAIGIAYDNLGICFAGDYGKQKVYFQKAVAASTAAGDHKFVGAELNNLCNIYLATGQLDSALYYAQRTQEMALKSGHPLVTLFSLNALSRVNEALGNKEVAYSYLRTALAHPHIRRDRRSLITTYSTIAGFFKKSSRRDSALFYAREAYDLSASSYLVYREEPTRLISELYTDLNSDSALRYTRLHTAIKDSIYSREKVQQLQLLDFEESQRQQKLEEERQAYIQYTAIGVGFVFFVLLVILLSSSVIVPQRLIEFFGIIGLLVMFEFLNLVLHPFLERVTHHSPVLMLLALVLIAAGLIPLHHRLEHWITNKMVAKNKAIRNRRVQKHTNSQL